MPNGELMLRLPEILSLDGHWLLTGQEREGRAGGVPTSDAAYVASLLEVALRLLREGGMETAAQLSRPAPKLRPSELTGDEWEDVAAAAEAEVESPEKPRRRVRRGR